MQDKLGWNILMRTIKPIVNDAVHKLFTQDYSCDNPFEGVTVSQKLSLRAIIEAAIRAELGTELTRPFGSPVNLSSWEKILLNPRQLFHLPSVDYNKIHTQTVIGPNAKKPLTLDIPIMITGMSYGGSLSLHMKTALAKGATMAGTSTNTGETALTKAERNAAKYLIGQYNRGGWMNTPEQLKQLDAIEVQLGQGAWGGAVDEVIKADHIGEGLRGMWHLKEGEDAAVHARMPGIETSQDIIDLLNSLKSQYDVPIGIKIAGSDFIEYDLAIIAQSNADYIVIDGSEGGTSSAYPTLEDNVGLPTLHSLVRCVKWLKDNKVRNKFSLIITGGLCTPGHFIKALALGADAVYIGTIALMAALQTQVNKAIPGAMPAQLALYDGKLKDELDIDQAAQHLANFLKSCVIEMKYTTQALGKNSLKDLNYEDLVTVDKDLAEYFGIRYAAQPRSDKYKK